MTYIPYLGTFFIFSRYPSVALARNYIIRYTVQSINAFNVINVVQAGRPEIHFFGQQLSCEK